MSDLLKLAERVGLTDDADKIWELLMAVLIHGSNPQKTWQELEWVYQGIDEYIKDLQVPPSEEEVARKHPGLCEDCE